jgi:hypothetical protein
VIFGLAVTTAAGFLPAAVNLVHRRPGATLRFLVGDPAFLVALLYVLCLSLLFFSVFGFVTAWHLFLLMDSTQVVQIVYRRVPIPTGKWQGSSSGAMFCSDEFTI